MAYSRSNRNEIRNFPSLMLSPTTLVHLWILLVLLQLFSGGVAEVHGGTLTLVNYNITSHKVSGEVRTKPNPFLPPPLPSHSHSLSSISPPSPQPPPFSLPMHLPVPLADALPAPLVEHRDYNITTVNGTLVIQIRPPVPLAAAVPQRNDGYHLIVMTENGSAQPYQPQRPRPSPTLPPPPPLRREQSGEKEQMEQMRYGSGGGAAPSGTIRPIPTLPTTTFHPTLATASAAQTTATQGPPSLVMVDYIAAEQQPASRRKFTSPPPPTTASSGSSSPRTTIPQVPYNALEASEASTLSKAVTAPTPTAEKAAPTTAPTTAATTTQPTRGGSSGGELGYSTENGKIGLLSSSNESSPQVERPSSIPQQQEYSAAAQSTSLSPPSNLTPTIPSASAPPPQLAQEKIQTAQPSTQPTTTTIEPHLSHHQSQVAGGKEQYHHYDEAAGGGQKMGPTPGGNYPTPEIIIIGEPDSSSNRRGKQDNNDDTKTQAPSTLSSPLEKVACPPSAGGPSPDKSLEATRGGAEGEPTSSSPSSSPPSLPSSPSPPSSPAPPSSPSPPPTLPSPTSSASPYHETSSPATATAAAELPSTTITTTITPTTTPTTTITIATASTITSPLLLSTLPYGPSPSGYLPNSSGSNFLGAVSYRPIPSVVAAEGYSPTQQQANNQSQPSEAPLLRPANWTVVGGGPSVVLSSPAPQPPEQQQNALYEQSSSNSSSILPRNRPPSPTLSYDEKLQQELTPIHAEQPQGSSTSPESHPGEPCPEYQHHHDEVSHVPTQTPTTTQPTTATSTTTTTTTTTAVESTTTSSPPPLSSPSPSHHHQFWAFSMVSPTQTWEKRITTTAPSSRSSEEFSSTRQVATFTSQSQSSGEYSEASTSSATPSTPQTTTIGLPRLVPIVFPTPSPLVPVAFQPNSNNPLPIGEKIPKQLIGYEPSPLLVLKEGRNPTILSSMAIGKPQPPTPHQGTLSSAENQQHGVQEEPTRWEIEQGNGYASSSINPSATTPSSRTDQQSSSHHTSTIIIGEESSGPGARNTPGPARKATVPTAIPLPLLISAPPTTSSPSDSIHAEQQGGSGLTLAIATATPTSAPAIAPSLESVTVTAVVPTTATVKSAPASIFGQPPANHPGPQPVAPIEASGYGLSTTTAAGPPVGLPPGAQLKQRDALAENQTEQLSSAQLELLKSTNNTTWRPYEMRCNEEVDDKGEELCGEWARSGLCVTNRPTMFLFCRRTCLCVGPGALTSSSSTPSASTPSVTTASSTTGLPPSAPRPLVFA